jgi:hypothetical protein
MWRLLYPLRYFRIENSEKRRIDAVATIVIAILVSSPFIFIHGAVFFGQGGFLDKLVILTSGLTGFYVAALVAAATFAHPDLDKTITAGPLALVTKDADGNRIREALTRREFVCTIFGYLAYLALALSVLSAAAISLSGIDLPKGHDDLVWYGRAIGVFVFSMMTAHLIVATSLGLYYLMDRLYRRDRQITSQKPGNHGAEAA